MFKEFKEFINRGNVIDLAVAVIIGAAFGKIVSSLTDNVIMPAIGAVFGNVDFSNLFVRLGAIPANFKGDPASFADLKAAGVPMIGYGDLVTQIVNFLILAWVIFLVVKAANKAMPKAEAPAGPSEVDLLTEIRDELKKRG